MLQELVPIAVIRYVPKFNEKVLQFAALLFCLPSCLSQDTEKHGLRQQGQGDRAFLDFRT